MVVRYALQLTGLVLTLLVIVPFYALAAPGEPGSLPEHLRSLASSYYSALLLGGLGVAVFSVFAGFTRIPRRIADVLAQPLNAVLMTPRGWTFALTAGIVSGLLALLLSAYVFSLRPALQDATSQLLHARYLAAGHLMGPDLLLPEFVTFQQMINLPTGWASQYPPGHIVFLALGFLIGTPWIVGPVLVSFTVVLTARLAEELLPDDVLAARLGTLFLALSLFFLLHAASYMNHVTAAASGVLALLGAVRGARDRTRARSWAVLSGFAAGVVFSVRPLSGIVTACVALACLCFWGTKEPIPLRIRRSLVRVTLFGLGTLPPLAAVGAYNQHLFGSPTTFGYIVAEGPGHGLGFHEDPWGNMYGPLDGLIQASRDLLALGMDLLVTPLSVVVVIGVYLLLARDRTRGLFVLLLWALLPVIAHFFYWHQDLFMGPRLLNEFSPPWGILSALASLELLRRSRDVGPSLSWRFDIHGTVLTAFVLSALLAATVLIPHRVALYAAQWGSASRIHVPRLGKPYLIFVHGDWADRLGARLAAYEMRMDSVRSALRYNTNCELQEYLDARNALGPEGRIPEGHAMGSRRQTPERLYFQPRRGLDIVEVRIGPSSVLRTHLEERPTAECDRQARADGRGVLVLSELIWQGDLPGLPPRHGMFIRDMGPQMNRQLLQKYAGREALVYLRPRPDLDPILLPYVQGMELLWAPVGEHPRHPSGPDG